MRELNAALRTNLETVQRKLAVAEEKRHALEKRREELTREVGLAKGRLNRKPEVDRFLEELQAEAHRKRVGDFERLLSALVAEVLPGEPQVGLDLEIERGQPSLDIVSRRGGDLTEDIYDDQGGALTNVVSMGLRMIAAVRSGTRRFLIMDESDCWIATSRVPTFYRVLKEAASKVGVQCLAISHHDVSAFSDGIAVARLVGDKDTGAQIENAPRRHKWGDDEDGIRWVRLKNFQTFVDETIHLSPGVNALEGRNNLGKSAIVRAFRAVFYGEGRDSLIRHGEKICTVEIGFSHGRTLHWDRQIRRNPINIWKLLGPDGAVIEEDGMIYETGGRTPPEWVAKLFGIRQVEGLDVHINKQKHPVFLLNRPGSTRASVLSIGQESSHILAMISLHKQRCIEDAACVKNGEAEMAKIIDDVGRLNALEALKERLHEARALLASIESRHAATEKLSEAVSRLISAQDVESMVQERAKHLSQLPSQDKLQEIIKLETTTLQLDRTAATIEAANVKLRYCTSIAVALDQHFGDVSKLKSLDDLAKDHARIVRLEEISTRIAATVAKHDICNRVQTVLSALPDVIPEIVRSDDKIIAGRAIRDAVGKLAFFERKAKAFAQLPESFPQFSSSLETEKAAARIEAAAINFDAIDQASQTLKAEEEACRVEIEGLVEEMDNACPLCGGHIDAQTLLQGHPHGGDHQQNTSI